MQPISNNAQTALVCKLGVVRFFNSLIRKVLLTLRLYEISLNYREFDEFKTARAESPIPNRAVRKGCYSIDA